MFGLPMLGVNMPAGRGAPPGDGRRDHARPGRLGTCRHAGSPHLRSGGRAEPDDEHRDADERPGQLTGDCDVALRARRHRDEPRRAGAAARRPERDAHGREHRPPRRRFPRRHVHRLDGRAPHGRADDGAARRPRAVRVARVLPDAAGDRQLLRRARRLRGHEAARHAGTAPYRRRRARDEHAAPVREPRHATLLQRQPDRRRPFRRTLDRRRRGRGGAWRDRLHRGGGRRSEGGNPHRLGHPNDRQRHVVVARPRATERLSVLEGASPRRSCQRRVRHSGCQRPRARLARRQPRRLLPARRGSAGSDDADARVSTGERHVRRQPDGHGHSDQTAEAAHSQARR